ncbi:MAG: AEC family transporter [Christensenellaceae bacterium]|nr:AEC family transporter [Christensenellaceae bacterium]
MEIALQLAKNIGGLFIILFVGFIFVKGKILKPEDTKTVSKIVLYMAMPSSIITSFQVEYTSEKLADFGVALLGGLLCQLIFMGIGWLMKRFGKFSDIECLSVAYPNVANLLIPIVTITMGQEWVIFTAAYCALQNIFSWTHQRMVLSGQKATFKNVFGNINIIAIIIGILLFAFKIKLPELIGNTLSMTAATLGPLSMFVIGMSVAAVSLKEIFSHKRLYAVLLLRLIICPIIMGLVFRFSGMVHMSPNAETVVLISMLSAAAPVSALTSQIAQLYGNEPAYAGALNLSTTLCCIVTMPLMAAFYQLLLML